MTATRLTTLLVASLITGIAQASSPTEQPATTVIDRAVASGRATLMRNAAQGYEHGRRLEMQVQAWPTGRARFLGLARAEWIMAEAASRSGHNQEALRRAEESLRLSQYARDDDAYADALITRGSIKADTGDMSTALSDYLQAASVFRRIGNERGQGVALQDLAGLYIYANDFKRGEQYLREAGDVVGNDPVLKATLANSIGNVLDAQGNQVDALAQYRDSLAYARRGGARRMMAITYGNIARIKAIGGDVRGARAALARARNLNGDEDHRFLTTSIRIFMKEGNQRRAIELVRREFPRPTGHAEPEYVEDHEVAAEVEQAAGDPRNAIGHLTVARALDRRTAQTTASASTAMMAARFDYENQRMRIEKLNAQQLRRDVADAHEANRMQLMILMAVVGAAIAVSLVFGIAYLVVRRSRDKEAEAKHGLEVALAEVDQRMLSEREARTLAGRDSLTGLPNRHSLHSEMYARACAERADGMATYVMLLDLDRFKPVNDVHGHAAGDAVLVGVAERLVETCSPVGAMPVRLGGDEFAVVMNCTTREDDAAKLARDIIESVSRPYEFGTTRLSISCTIGITRQPEGGGTLSELLRSADIAMYEAKRAGRRTYREFKPEMEAELRHRSSLEQDLRQAVRDDRIAVAYQPIVSMADGTVSGYEALARWRHPELGDIGPAEFIPIAEEAGLMEQLTLQILQRACRDARDLDDEIGVSVNLSPVLLRDEWIAARIQTAVAAERIAPSRITIEVTEDAVIDNMALATGILAALREAGMRVVLDDFGKGHSSLSQLRDLPLDGMKMDASFARDLHEGRNMQITTAIAGMAAAMELPVVAEGIETPEVYDTLAEMGFTYGQGYLLGRPMTMDEVLAAGAPASERTAA
jgi:diguanylate cyclase (GGDEF)-like protein